MAPDIKALTPWPKLLESGVSVAGSVWHAGWGRRRKGVSLSGLGGLGGPDAGWGEPVTHSLGNGNSARNRKPEFQCFSHVEVYFFLTLRSVKVGSQGWPAALLGPQKGSFAFLAPPSSLTPWVPGGPSPQPEH